MQEPVGRNESDCGQELGGGTPGRSTSNGWGTAARKRGYSKNRMTLLFWPTRKTASRMVESRWLEASRKVSNRGRRLCVRGMRGWLVQDKCRDRDSLVVIQQTSAEDGSRCSESATTTRDSGREGGIDLEAGPERGETVTMGDDPGSMRQGFQVPKCLQKGDDANENRPMRRPHSIATISYPCAFFYF